MPAQWQAQQWANGSTNQRNLKSFKFEHFLEQW